MGRLKKSNFQIRQENQKYIASCVERLMHRGSFSKAQRREIMIGFESGLAYNQVEWYAHPSFSPAKMRLMRAQLLVRHSKSVKLLTLDTPAVDLSMVDSPKKDKGKSSKNTREKGSYTPAQLSQINAGLKKRRVAKGEYLFRNPSLTVKQIIQIQVGLENGLPLEQVEFYACKKFSDIQMAQIRRGLENGLTIEDVSEYAKASYTAVEMRSIRCKLEDAIHKSEEKSIEGHHVMQNPEQPAVPQQQKQHPKETEKLSIKYRNKSITAKSFFSDKLIENVNLRNPDSWASWFQSKQVFVYDDAFAATILANTSAVDEVDGDVLLRCPYTAAYITAKEESGAQLEFFSNLRDDTVHFCQVQSDSVLRNCELRIQPGQKGREILAGIEEDTEKESVRKMFQLYIGLCAAELEDTATFGNNSHFSPPISGSETYPPSRCETPTWDVDVYTVMMRQDTKKSYRRRSRNENSGVTLRRPHKRRAHWHHYWVGPRSDSSNRRLVVKWVPEIDVNPTQSDLPMRIIIVRH